MKFASHTQKASSKEINSVLLEVSSPRGKKEERRRKGEGGREGGEERMKEERDKMKIVCLTGQQQRSKIFTGALLMLIPHAVMVDGDLPQPALAQFEYQVFYHPPGPARLEMRMKGKRMADGVGHTTPAFVPPTSADAQESKGQRGPYAYCFTSVCEADLYNMEIDCCLGGDVPHGPLYRVKVRD